VRREEWDDEPLWPWAEEPEIDKLSLLHKAELFATIFLGMLVAGFVIGSLVLVGFIVGVFVAL